MKRANRLFKEGLILALITVPFFFWLFKRYMHLDFWYDEIFSFDQFIFVPLKKTVTSYYAPNNHIFANLLHNLYVKLLGVPDLFTLMDTPYKMRLVPLACSIVTLIYMYFTGKRLFNQAVAYLMLIILVTTIPFYNFAVQVRGYSLSMTLVTMVLYYVWNFERTLQWRNAFGAVLCAVLALYTIPLNVYFLTGLAGFYFFVGVYRFFKERPGKAVLVSLFRGDVSEENKHFAIVLLIGIAIIIGICIYLPFYENFIDNRHFKSHGMFSNPDVLTSLMPETLLFFLSKRYLFIPGIFMSLCSCFIPSIRRRHHDLTFRCLCCGFVLCAPFILSFIRGDKPPSRAFVNLSPVFVVFVALNLWLVYKLIPAIRLNNALILLGVIVYGHTTFAYNLHHINLYLKSDIEQGKITYNVYYNYFQAYYRPMDLVQEFMKNYYTRAIPVTLILNSEEYEIRRYLDKFQVQYYHHPYQILFNQYGQAFVVTAFARDVTARLSHVLPQFRCGIVAGELNFHKILYCEAVFE